MTGSVKLRCGTGDALDDRSGTDRDTRARRSGEPDLRCAWHQRPRCAKVTFAKYDERPNADLRARRGEPPEATRGRHSCPVQRTAEPTGMSGSAKARLKRECDHPRFSALVSPNEGEPPPPVTARQTRLHRNQLSRCEVHDWHQESTIFHSPPTAGAKGGRRQPSYMPPHNELPKPPCYGKEIDKEE